MAPRVSPQLRPWIWENLKCAFCEGFVASFWVCAVLALVGPLAGRLRSAEPALERTPPPALRKHSLYHLCPHGSSLPACTWLAWPDAFPSPAHVPALSSSCHMGPGQAWAAPRASCAEQGCHPGSREQQRHQRRPCRLSAPGSQQLVLAAPPPQGPLFPTLALGLPTASALPERYMPRPRAPSPSMEV